jgi:Flp pilus assembly protein TadG
MRSTQKSRRGSTLVMVALMLGAFMGIAAIAADIGRFYVVAGELQTAADAAALKGAAVLQFTTANFSATVDDSVTIWASNTNRADGNTLTIARDSIDVGYWSPGANGVAGTFVVAGEGGPRPNAVLVKASGAPRGVFAQMIGRTAGLPLSRRGIAWIGNISLNCTRPWAMQYLPLVQKVNLNNDTTQLLDMSRFVTYQNTSVANRTFIMRQEFAGNIPPSDGTWSAFNLPSQQGGGATSGATMYQAQIANCNNIAVNSDAGNGNYQPSQGNGPCGEGTLVCWANEMIDGETSGSVRGPGICATMLPDDATCRDQGGTAGVTTDMTFANKVGNGAGGIDFKYVGEVTLLCYFKFSTDRCDAIPDPRDKTGYPPGTLVVITQGLKSRTLNPTDIISNAPSNVQKLFLVR